MEINYILEFIGLVIVVVGGAFAAFLSVVGICTVLEKLYRDKKIKIDNKINTTVFILMLVCLVVFLVMFHVKNLSSVLTVSDSTFTFGHVLHNN